MVAATVVQKAVKTEQHSAEMMVARLAGHLVHWMAVPRVAAMAVLTEQLTAVH